jgi:type II secretory pathway pseudopilin PulG
MDRKNQRRTVSLSAQQAGTTLLEIVLALGVLMIVVATGFSFSPSFSERQTLIQSKQVIESGLDLAAKRTLLYPGSTWGIFIQGANVTVFKGASYAGRTATFDELLNFPSPVTITGITEYVATNTTGLLYTTGSTTIASQSITLPITVTAKGVVN